jgi:hypothetical protein
LTARHGYQTGRLETCLLRLDRIPFTGLAGGTYLPRVEYLEEDNILKMMGVHVQTVQYQQTEAAPEDFLIAIQSFVSTPSFSKPLSKRKNTYESCA